MVDANGQIALIHETAREYLVQRESMTDALIIDRKATHDKICQRSLQCLTDPMLRSHINQEKPPGFLDYASGSWFAHFAQGHSKSLEILNEVLRFLAGPQVLVWIQAVAKDKQLGSLLAASRYLTLVTSKLRNLDLENYSGHREAMDMLTSWVTDLVKIVGKFGRSLTQRLADTSESPDGTSDSLGETESVAKVSVHTDQYFSQATKATTIAAQVRGSLYCYGTESGVVILSEVGLGVICEVERLASYMCIEQVAWSHDGCLIAIGDLSGRLVIKKVFKEDPQVSWQVKHEFHVVIPTKNGHIEQIFFSTSDDRLFVATAGAFFVVTMSSHEVSEYPLPSDTSRRKWICHPQDHGPVLGFGTEDVCINNDRNGHSEVWSRKYDPSRITTPTLLLPNIAVQPQVEREFRTTMKESLGRLLTDETSTYFILQISTPSHSSPPQSEYLVFSSADISAKPPDKHFFPTADLPYTTIPDDVACRIRQPLALLSRRRLLFLDSERWICTWSLDSVGARHPQRGRGSGPDSMGVEQHYLLPGDWAMAEEVRRCTAMFDGTFLCPRNGDVAAVKFSKLKG